MKAKIKYEINRPIRVGILIKAHKDIYLIAIVSDNLWIPNRERNF